MKICLLNILVQLAKERQMNGLTQDMVIPRQGHKRAKGDAMVTYEDPHAALAVVEWFNKDFHGTTIGVFIAESKSKDDHLYNLGDHVEDPSLGSDFGGLDESARDVNGRGRGRDDASGKA